MKYDLEKLEQYVSLQAEFSQKKDVLDFIHNIQKELREELKNCDLNGEYCDKCTKIKEVLGET